MKKVYWTIAVLGLLISSCKPELKGELGEPSDKIAGLQGTWEISNFVQQDPNNPIKEERDLSEFYINGTDTPYRLHFSREGKIYTVETGPGRNYFGSGGTWSFDNEEFPTYLMLFTPGDTLQMALGSVVRPTDNNLNLQYENYCEDGAGVRTTSAVYKFKFIRVS